MSRIFLHSTKNNFKYNRTICYGLPIDNTVEHFVNGYLIEKELELHDRSFRGIEFVLLLRKSLP